MLFIEAERMGACLYDPEDVASERTVIISELQGGENEPEQLLDQEVTATAFRAHAYGHPTIGWLSDLQSMSREDLFAHYRRFYVPNNATLVLVGDFGPRTPAAGAGALRRHYPGDVGRRMTTEASRWGRQHGGCRARLPEDAYRAPALMIQTLQPCWFSTRC
jgi:hypothetical protein